MFTITRYNKISKFAGQADFKEAIKVIREERFVRLISNIRRLKSVGKTEEANKLKQSLPSFTASGVFSRRRKVESLHQYNPLFVLDIDKIDDLDMLYSVRQKAVSNPHTLACFISPSGNGLKIFVRSDNTQIEHENTFNLIADHYESLLCIPIDRSG